jgi:hypothetical protein
MNVKFNVKGLLLALPLGCLLAAGWIFWQTPLGRPLDPTPPPPTILVPRGPMPAGPVGLEEWARYRGGDYQRTGSGFLLTLADGEVVAVTTAHSVALGDAAHPLERIALRVAGQSGFVGEFDTLRGPPGQHFTLENLTLDYLLLQPGAPLAPGLALAPDPVQRARRRQRRSPGAGRHRPVGQRGGDLGADGRAFRPQSDERLTLCQPAHRPGGGHGPGGQLSAQPALAGSAPHRLAGRPGRNSKTVHPHHRVAALAALCLRHFVGSRLTGRRACVILRA